MVKVQTAPTLDEEFEVEKIVGKKMEDGKTFYLIKWRGYNDSENTWEPVEHMEGSMDLVRQYEISNQKVARKCSVPTTPSVKKGKTTVKDSQLELEDWNEIEEAEPKVRTVKKAIKRPKMTLGAFPFDTVKTVIRQYREEGELKFEVSWKERDGVAPGNSVVDLEEFAERQPKKLIEFLVEALRSAECESDSS